MWSTAVNGRRKLDSGEYITSHQTVNEYIIFTKLSKISYHNYHNSNDKPWYCGWINVTTLMIAYIFIPWWRHQIEILSALRDLCVGSCRPPVNSPHKGQWRGTLMFSLICAWTNVWVNHWNAGDLRCHHAHYLVIVMTWPKHRWHGADK